MKHLIDNPWCSDVCVCVSDQVGFLFPEAVSGTASFRLPRGNEDCALWDDQEEWCLLACLYF